MVTHEHQLVPWKGCLAFHRINQAHSPGFLIRTCMCKNQPLCDLEIREVCRPWIVSIAISHDGGMEPPI